MRKCRGKIRKGRGGREMKGSERNGMGQRKEREDMRIREEKENRDIRRGKQRER